MAGLISWRRERAASLFERIEHDKQQNAHASRAGELLNSIKRNLNQVLNSHPGGSQSAPFLGVIDLNDATASASDYRRAIEEAIRDCIVHYEPRLSRVIVTASRHDASDPLTLSFEIMAYVDLENMDRLVEFNIYLDNHQRYYLG